MQSQSAQQLQSQTTATFFDKRQKMHAKPLENNIYMQYLRSRHNNSNATQIESIVDKAAQARVMMPMQMIIKQMKAPAPPHSIHMTSEDTRPSYQSLGVAVPMNRFSP